jgi:hypothetical protein
MLGASEGQMANYRFVNSTGPIIRLFVAGILFLKNGRSVIVQGRKEVAICKANDQLTYVVD